MDTGRVHPRVGSGQGSDLILPQTFVDYFVTICILAAITWVAQDQITGHGFAVNCMLEHCHGAASRLLIDRFATGRWTA